MLGFQLRPGRTAPTGAVASSAAAQALFRNGEQGVLYDPNDLTAEKISWRRNLLTYSSQFDNTAWTKSNVTVARVGDDAFKVTEDTANAQHVVFEITAYTLAAAAYTASVEAKAAERSFIRIQIETSGGVVYAGARFNLTTGQVVAGDVVVASGASAPVARIAATQDGFYRVELTATLPAGALARHTVRLVQNETGFNYPGDGVSGLFIKNAQLELGGAASSYQKITDFNTEFLQSFPNHALFQDSAGTTPATAAGQPVGLMLDKRLGLVRGAEKVVNGDFTASVAGWTPNNSSPQAVGGRARVVTTASGPQSQIFQPLAGAGTWYEVTANFYGLPVGRLAKLAIYSASLARDLAAHTTTGVADGQLRCVAYVPSGASFSVILLMGSNPVAGEYLEWDNVSVRELPGDHAFQPTAASRPMLRQNATTGAHYLETDGSDDWMSTNAIDFTATDKVSVFTGVRKLSDAAVGAVFEFGPNVATTNGSFSLFAPISAGVNTVTFSSRGSATQSAGIPSVPAPINLVLSGDCSISGDSVRARANGGSYANNTADQGTGNLGNYPLYLFRRGGTSLPFNGHFYGLTIVGRLCTDAERNAVERMYAAKTGVVLV